MKRWGSPLTKWMDIPLAIGLAYSGRQIAMLAVLNYIRYVPSAARSVYD